MDQKRIKKSTSRAVVTTLLWLTLLIGIGLIAYPRIDARIQQNKQEDLLTQWSDKIRFRSNDPPSANAESLLQTPNAASVNLPIWKEVDGFQLLGSVRIDSIELNEPIVRGADAKSLKQGAGSVVEDRLPGQAGNFVLAGHRSWTFGRHFNRLGELKPGDEIDIDTSAGLYRYSITETTLVLPEDLSVLDNNAGDDSVLTLITCHPKRNPTHRMIIKATLIKNEH
ncbi:class D sortase [Cohnella lupini]|uniref:Sortase A n=1 Tax=Cohnella lupini TaxID=1294267 RepID=A0A3D9IIN5_9BACL|nr:class D sortase [Cohnella lupini]RED61600.1 sortase A [Cohnella lupini]